MVPVGFARAVADVADFDVDALEIDSALAVVMGLIESDYMLALDDTGDEATSECVTDTLLV